jgi:hypothetical protein
VWYGWYADRDTLGPISTKLEVRRFREAPTSGEGGLRWDVDGFKLYGWKMLPELLNKHKSLGSHWLTIK